MSKEVRAKKGNVSWQPASVTDVVNKEPGYRYRWSLKDPDNLAKRAQENWETVGLSSDKATLENPGNVNGGSKMTSVFEKRDVILQRIPEEVAQARDKWFNEESERRIAGLTDHIKKETAKEGVSTHGEITITSRRGQQVIN